MIASPVTISIAIAIFGAATGIRPSMVAAIKRTLTAWSWAVPINTGPPHPAWACAWPSSKTPSPRINTRCPYQRTICRQSYCMRPWRRQCFGNWWRRTGSSAPLASAIHGLGLLAALAMGVSGAWLYTEDEPGGLVLKVHRALSNLMWAYVIGHAGVAVLHQFFGHRILQGMFGRKADIPQP